MLVDDEEMVRQAIVQKLDWAALGFTVAGQAANGEEALELAEQIAPDVIMTDIKMPFMDGLEFCRRVREQQPGVRLAIFSGFDEFEYAKEAMASQVEEYLLKPINAEELSGVFQRLRASLDEEIAQRRDVDSLRRRYEESLPLLRHQAVHDLLNGRTGLRVESLAEYGMDMQAAGYCVAVLEPHLPPEVRGGTEEQMRLVPLQQLVQERLAGQMGFYMAQAAGRWAVLFLLPQAGGRRRAGQLLSALFPLAQKQLGLKLGIGVGAEVGSLREIALSYRQAQQALDYQILTEPFQCIYIEDIEPGAGSGQGPDAALAEEILRQVKVGHEAELRAAVDAFARELKRENLSIQQYQICLMELATGLLKLIRSYGLNPEEAGAASLLEGCGAGQFSRMEEMGEWLFGACNRLRGAIRRERKDSARQLVEQAKSLLEERYASCELSQDWLCGKLNVSQAYFSTLFKKETGQSFISYLTALRMEKALELLAVTDQKTYQIAEAVGYADANYFSYVFKKQFGLSPSKYKEGLQAPS